MGATVGGAIFLKEVFCSGKFIFWGVVEASFLNEIYKPKKVSFFDGKDVASCLFRNLVDTIIFSDLRFFGGDFFIKQFSVDLS